ncbi:MAG: SPOR domain-containing protein [Nitrospirota bacterium]
MYCPICDKPIEKYGRRKTDLKKPDWVFCPIHGWMKELEEKGEKPDLSEETDLQKLNLAERVKKRINLLINKSASLIRSGLIIPALSGIVVIILFALAINYLVLRSPLDENIENNAVEVPVSVREPSKLAQADVSNKEIDSRVHITEKPAQPLTSPETIYAVQAGAFRDVSNAEVLKKRLNEKGYNAYIVEPEDGSFYKVLISASIDRQKALKLSEKIKDTEGLSSFVTLRKE